MKPKILLAKDLMTVDPEFVSPETPLREIIALMNRCDCRQVPVLDEKKVVGIITDRDIRLAVNSPALNDEPLERLAILDEVTAADCMTRDPISVHRDTPIFEIAGILARNKFGALLVMNEGNLEGIVTVTDLLNQMALKPEN